MKRIFRFLPLFLLSAVMTSCEVHDVTMVDLQEVVLKKIDKTEMYLDVTAVLDNPNSFKINVTGSDLDLYLEERYIGKATMENSVTLNAKSEEAYDLEIKAKGENLNVKLLPILLSAALTGKVTVRLEGEVKGKVFLFTRGVNIDIKEDVDFNKRTN